MARLLGLKGPEAPHLCISAKHAGVFVGFTWRGEAVEKSIRKFNPIERLIG